MRRLGNLLMGTVLAWSQQCHCAHGQSKEKHKNAPTFAYYVLVLSYAPSFCLQTAGDKDPRECGAGRHTSFLVQGLWAQGETTRGPENCGSPGLISGSIIQTMLNYMPTESLIQHEWKSHGTCSGLGTEDFFYAVRKARDSLDIPPDLNAPSQMLELTPAQIEEKFAAENRGFPAKAFRTSCYPDKSLQEVRVCFNRDLSPRPCGSSAGACSATSVKIPPVQ